MELVSIFLSHSAVGDASRIDLATRWVTGRGDAGNKVELCDLLATIRHLLGLISSRYVGCDFSLTDVYDNVVHDRMA